MFRFDNAATDSSALCCPVISCGMLHYSGRQIYFFEISERRAKKFLSSLNDVAIVMDKVHRK
jgi:hypothetical protein